MTSFSQLGDPVCAACLCEHHGAVYAEWDTLLNPISQSVVNEDIANGATIVQVPITITERCCVVVNAATLVFEGTSPNHVEIERPLGTIRTQQRDSVETDNLVLLHHAAWEVLDPGAYTYYLVNRSGYAMGICAAWIKAIASDCEG